MTGLNASLRVELLGDRALPSGFGFFGGFFHPSATVQADIAQLQTDTQKLHSDLVSLGPTLQQDRQALQTAVQNALTNDSDVVAAENTLKADRAAAVTTLSADWKAIFSATDAASRSAAFKQLQTDLTAVGQTLKADRAALRTAISNDAGVQAATAQLQADAAPIVADKAAIQADLTKLQADIKSGA